MRGHGLDERLAEVIDDLRGRYTIGYHPTEEKPRDRFVESRWSWRRAPHWVRRNGGCWRETDITEGSEKCVEHKSKDVLDPAPSTARVR